MSDMVFLFLCTIIVSSIALIGGIAFRELRAWWYIRKHYTEEED